MTNQQTSLVTPRLVTLVSLKTRRDLNIVPLPSGIVSSGSPATIADLKNSAIGLDLAFPPIVNGPISLTNNGGAIATGAPVQLIFWGSIWSQASTTPSASGIIAAIQDILSGSYMLALRQYGIKRSPFRDAIIVTSPQPPSTFSDGDIQDLVFSLIDDEKFPEPDEDGGRNLYFVMMPPGTQYSPGGARGAHSVASDYDFPFEVDHAWVAWIGNNNIDQMTSTFCHELVEMCTDPEGDAWTVNGQPSPTNEIGDICNLIDRPLNGVQVEAYWSQFDNACIIPDAFSLRRSLIWAGKKLNGKGIRSLQFQIPSLKEFIANL